MGIKKSKKLTVIDYKVNNIVEKKVVVIKHLE